MDRTLLRHPRPLAAIVRHPTVAALARRTGWTRARAASALLREYGADPRRPAHVTRSSWTLAHLPRS